MIALLSFAALAAWPRALPRPEVASEAHETGPAVAAGRAHHAVVWSQASSRRMGGVFDATGERRGAIDLPPLPADWNPVTADVAWCGDHYLAVWGGRRVLGWRFRADGTGIGSQLEAWGATASEASLEAAVACNDRHTLVAWVVPGTGVGFTRVPTGSPPPQGVAPRRLEAPSARGIDASSDGNSFLVVTKEVNEHAAPIDGDRPLAADRRMVEEMPLGTLVGFEVGPAGGVERRDLSALRGPPRVASTPGGYAVLIGVETAQVVPLRGAEPFTPGPFEPRRDATFSYGRDLACRGWRCAVTVETRSSGWASGARHVVTHGWWQAFALDAGTSEPPVELPNQRHPTAVSMGPKGPFIARQITASDGHRSDICAVPPAGGAPILSETPVEQSRVVVAPHARGSVVVWQEGREGDNHVAVKAAYLRAPSKLFLAAAPSQLLGAAGGRKSAAVLFTSYTTAIPPRWDPTLTVLNAQGEEENYGGFWSRVVSGDVAFDGEYYHAVVTNEDGVARRTRVEESVGTHVQEYLGEAHDLALACGRGRCLALYRADDDALRLMGWPSEGKRQAMGTVAPDAKTYAIEPGDDRALALWVEGGRLLARVLAWDGSTVRTETLAATAPSPQALAAVWHQGAWDVWWHQESGLARAGVDGDGEVTGRDPVEGFEHVPALYTVRDRVLAVVQHPTAVGIQRSVLRWVD